MPRTARLNRLGPWTLVAFPVVFNLWSLRAEISAAYAPNDSALHLSMIQWARQVIDRGAVPLDGWFPYLGLGSAHFHHYQVLAHVISAYASVFFGTTTTYLWSLYLLLALWPLAVYLGVRLMGWDEWVAAAAALLSPLLMSASGYGFERGSYTWRGYGLWPQLWGMWALPMAWGLSWQAVRGAGGTALAALGVALAIAFHFLMGALALIGLVVFSLASRAGLLRHVLRAGLVAVGALLASLWVIVPLLADSRWIPVSEFVKGTVFADSYGARRILGWLFTGQLYDAGRVPVVSLLVAVGLVVCILRFRRDARARSLLILWIISLILFFGPRTLGPLITIVPMLDLLPMHRFVTGVHMTGIVLAGVGGVWLAAWLVNKGRHYLPEIRVPLQVAVVAGVGVVALSPAWKQTADFDASGMIFIHTQQRDESVEGPQLMQLVTRMRTAGPGRVYAGSRASWGSQYMVGYIPMYSVLEDLNLDVVGYTLRVTSLMTDPEAYFDENNPAQYDLFNIRYLVLPSDRQPPVPATLLATQGRHELWQVVTSGYLEVVDTVGPAIVANRGNLGSQTLPFMSSADLAHKQFHWVAYEGSPTPPPTLGSSSASDAAAGLPPAGVVTREQDSPAAGHFQAEVTAARTAVVLLKASFDPHWKVTVDGVDVQPQMVAPALVGVPVPSGRHIVVFQYAPVSGYPILIGLGLLGVLGLAVLPWFQGRRRRVGTGFSALLR